MTENMMASGMKILVANDDGIGARGIKALVRSLCLEAGAEVYVFAPDGQRSAAGHAISLHIPVEVRKTEYENAKAAYAVSGTPADCVAVGLRVLENRGIVPDMVFAGINHGSNVGTDTVYSGTVASALEGSIHGIPSAAVSVDSPDPQHFEYACRLAVDTIRKTGGSWDPEIMLNINTPDMPERDIKGVVCTVLGEREYSNDVQLKSANGELEEYIYGGEAIPCEEDSLKKDVAAIQKGYASITPMHRDMTAHHAMKETEKWRIGI